MRVTRDKYELPIAIADTAKQLAEICHTSSNTIYSAIWHADRGNKRSSYRRIEIDEDGEDEDDD